MASGCTDELDCASLSIDSASILLVRLTSHMHSPYYHYTRAAFKSAHQLTGTVRFCNERPHGWRLLYSEEVASASVSLVLI